MKRPTNAFKAWRNNKRFWETVVSPHNRNNPLYSPWFSTRWGTNGITRWDISSQREVVILPFSELAEETRVKIIEDERMYGEEG